MSNPIIYRFTLDMQKSTSNVFCFVQQGDTASRLEITLNENGEPLILTAGTTAILCALKSDGALLYNTATVDTTNNKIVYQFNTQTANVAGLVACQIKLTISGTVKSSPLFRLDVQNNVIDEGSAVVESEDDINVLTGYIALIAEGLSNGSFKGEKGDPGEDGADGAPGEKGDTGNDGFSPIATVSKSGTTTTINVTDKNGTTTAEVLDGRSVPVIVGSYEPPRFASSNNLFSIGDMWIHNGIAYTLVSILKDSAFSSTTYDYNWKPHSPQIVKSASAVSSTAFFDRNYGEFTAISTSFYRIGDIHINSSTNEVKMCTNVTRNVTNQIYNYTWITISQ